MFTVDRLNELKEVLYSGVIADILDQFGIRNNAMQNNIRPLKCEMKVFGTVFTILATDVYEEPLEPYKLELEAVDKVKHGEIIVATTNGSVSAGFWGELLSTCAAKRGCNGAVIDGCTRDARMIINMGFQLFVRGFCPYDSKGRIDVIAYQVPIKCGGVLVNPGDYIFGDIDGIVVIPSKIADQVIQKALEKVAGENIVREKLKAGENVKDVYDEFGIL